MNMGPYRPEPWPSFDGTGDCISILDWYRCRAESVQYSSRYLRPIFTQKLQGDAKRYYQSMRDKSSLSFLELLDCFEEHFVFVEQSAAAESAFIQRQKSEQGPTESLEDFGWRMWCVSEIEDPEKAISMFMINLHPRYKTESTRAIFENLRKGKLNGLVEITAAVKRAHQIDVDRKFNNSKVTFKPVSPAHGKKSVFQQANTLKPPAGRVGYPLTEGCHPPLQISQPPISNVSVKTFNNKDGEDDRQQTIMEKPSQEVVSKVENQSSCESRSVRHNHDRQGRDSTRPPRSRDHRCCYCGKYGHDYCTCPVRTQHETEAVRMNDTSLKNGTGMSVETLSM